MTVTTCYNGDPKGSPPPPCGSNAHINEQFNRSIHPQEECPRWCIRYVKR